MHLSTFFLNEQKSQIRLHFHEYVQMLYRLQCVKHQRHLFHGLSAHLVFCKRKYLRFFLLA